MEIQIANKMGEPVKTVTGEVVCIIKNYGNKNGFCEAVITVDGHQQTAFILQK